MAVVCVGLVVVGPERARPGGRRGVVGAGSRARRAGRFDRVDAVGPVLARHYVERGAQGQGDQRLRTHGPYAVTRHPIYTGVLGMLVGATLVSGIGQWIVLFPVGLIVFEVKIRMEERLMVATFPDEYPRYRRRVPQLIPGLYVLRQRHSASSNP